MKALICFTLLVLLEAPKALGAVGIYVPPDMGPGNSSLAAPFDTSTSSRLQQVYGHEGFEGIVPPMSAVLIHGIYFQVDENAGSFDETFPRVQVDLSTTSRGPDGLSTVFSENIGPDRTTVFGPGPLHLSGDPARPPGFMFERTYLYDPHTGNLLVDIQNFGPGRASVLDAFNVLGDSVSIVGNEDINSPTGSRFTRGLATMFWVDIVLIPEPSASALLLMGLVAIAWKLRRSSHASIPNG